MSAIECTLGATASFTAPLVIVSDANRLPGGDRTPEP